MVKTQFGLTTLIIFIAMIVTAAIAAGVIIYTTQTLQQRALQVGAQARERVA
ncbi:MAG: flagellin, partial [Candidatus Aenigmatarchaeota archaeon]